MSKLVVRDQFVLDVSVTQQDIDNGEKRDCASCPVAVAVRRALADMFPAMEMLEISVTLANTQVWMRGHPADSSYYARHPKSIQNFIVRFDIDNEVEPLTAQITLERDRAV